MICQSAESAVVFLSTGRTFTSGYDESSIAIEVAGADGAQQFTFASGTSRANIIIAVNSFREAIAVSATSSVVDPNRVEFRSIGFSYLDFVRVKKLNALTNDFIFTSAMATGALDQHKDSGQSLMTLSPFRP